MHKLRAGRPGTSRPDTGTDDGKRMRVWFTSDTHFDHRLVAGNRGFAAPAEHDAALVDNWNDLVGPDDEVWHLGDLGMGDPARWVDTVRRLHGRIHLVTGNHDRCAPGVRRDAHRHQRAWLEFLTSVQPFARRRLDGHTVLLSHYPYVGDHTATDRYRQWRLPDLGDRLLHGHVHSTDRLHGRQLHVGLDAWELRPVAAEEITALFDGRGAE
ncbi:metallophosphoesterase family protein [Saccharomonospora halophila]|uniref:metallophosphoesterase family protein n=1 Tax=Saccharomonospora halophila TaxID=129922 RepID=UPI00037DDCB3|nr:metallophosphoesterase family protein [Saccharomonospora halophila]